jgi:hypothetical protein
MDKQAKFFELAKYAEQLQEKASEVREEMNQLMTELGVGTYVQDPETSTVYKIVKPKGTFTYYRDIEYNRTALEGERAGTLSKKEAEEAGFKLKK